MRPNPAPRDVKHVKKGLLVILDNDALTGEIIDAVMELTR